VSVTYAINTAAQIIANTEAIRDIGESLGRLGMGGDIGGILVSATAPSSPKVNELWIDIS
jgi:hypothetical protein